MIQQTVDVIADAIDERLSVTLAAMPGAGAFGLAKGAEIKTTRHLLDDQMMMKIPIGVRVEQQDATEETWPMEAQEEATVLQLGVTCWLVRWKNAALKPATDDEMVRAVRALVRAVSASIRYAFSPVPAIDRDGVQVRCPVTATYGEPEQGDDGALTVMTLSLSVPVVDYWALSAGGV